MRKLVSFLSLAVLFLLTFLYFGFKFFSYNRQYDIYKLEKGWTVTYHNQKYLNTNLEHLSHQVGNSFSRGDVVNLNQTTPLPDLEAPFPYIAFKTRMCRYEIFLDDEMIDSTTVDDANNKVFVGTGYNFVSLPKDYAGKRLTIKLYVTENATRADIITPMIGDFDDLYRELVHSVIYPFIIGLFMIMFGEVFLVISLLFYIKTSGVGTQILCSILTIVLGCWLLAAFDITDFLLLPATSTTIEYSAMYLTTPLLYAIVLNLHRRNNNLILMIMGAATTIFSLSFIALHVMNVVHINHFQYPYYFISIASLVILFAYDFIDFKSKSRNSSTLILMGGITFLALSLISYVVYAILRSFVDFRQNKLVEIIMTTGAMMFVFMQLLNYFVFMTHSFAQKKEYAALTKIAYIDNLTGLPNRVSGDEKMAELDRSEDDFCLLSLDLNGLKEVNDNAGHPAGDKLLRSFADTLLSVFGSLGTCARIGGDEFLVLIRTTTAEEVDERLRLLDQKLLILDEEDQDVNHSVSYGYAFRHEAEEKDAHTVFMLADKRMYDFKRAHYAHLMSR
jgi:diguanylate cyclase (GGDEF)-like protein